MESTATSGVIRHELIPEHTRTDIMEVVFKGVTAYQRYLQESPERMRQYLERKAERQNAQRK